MDKFERAKAERQAAQLQEIRETLRMEALVEPFVTPILNAAFASTERKRLISRETARQLLVRVAQAAYLAGVEAGKEEATGNGELSR